MAHVLVVEDEEGDRLLLRSLLESGGHEVYFARNGEEAYKLYLRKGIEVVVTDLQMPHVDGLKFIEELLSLFPDAPVIAVSGQSKDQLDMAKMMGAVLALPKPVDRETLLKAVADASEMPGADRWG